MFGSLLVYCTLNSTLTFVPSSLNVGLKGPLGFIGLAERRRQSLWAALIESGSPAAFKQSLRAQLSKLMPKAQLAKQGSADECRQLY